MRKILKKKIDPMGPPPGVPRVPILGPNRGIFSKFNWPGPLGSGGHSHTIFSNGRFQGTQWSFGGDVICDLYAISHKMNDLREAKLSLASCRNYNFFLSGRSDF